MLCGLVIVRMWMALEVDGADNTLKRSPILMFIHSLLGTIRGLIAPTTYVVCPANSIRVKYTLLRSNFVFPSSSNDFKNMMFVELPPDTIIIFMLNP